MRLDKYLSNSTGLSRSQVKRLIRDQQVQVNGQLQTNPAQAVSESDQIQLAEQTIAAPEPRYFMFHKPLGVVSATKDRDHATAIDYFYDEPRPEQLQIAGRLDIDATGLLLVTDDGQWNHRVTSPKKHCVKTYLAELADPVLETEQANWQAKFNKGIWLNNEKRRTQPATIEFLDACQIRLQISEGKYHQVKRMCAALGNKVDALHRIAIGDILLDEELAPGEYRELSPAEVASIP